MAIGKIVNTRVDGSGDNSRTIAHIILLPSFPVSRYTELKIPAPSGSSYMSGSTIWSESGHKLEVKDAAGYPYISAKSIDPGKVWGKVTTDDKESVVWLKKIGNDLLPSNIKGLPLWTGLAQWNIRWKPLKDRLNSSENSDQAIIVVREIRESINLSGLAKDVATSVANPKESISMTGNAGKQALKEATVLVKTEVGSWWKDIGLGWKIGSAAAVIVVGGMIISEKVD